MTQHTFVVVTLTVGLSAAAIGCRNSTTSASATPAASATPRVVQLPLATPVSAQARATPLVPIQVTPPAAFSPDQIPQDSAVKFALPASAGDFLVLKVSEVVNPASQRTSQATTMPTHAAPKAKYAVSVGLPTLDPSGVRVIQEGGSCTDTSLYQLAQTGIYQVVLDTSEGRKQGYKYGISFTLLAKDDPVVDPGIKPEQVSIDFGTFAKGKELSAVPPVLAEGCLDESWPAHLAVSNERIQFRIMQVAGYEKVFPSDHGLALLEAAITAGETETVAGLPYASSDVGLQMWARQQTLEGDGWRGLRWIGGYGQDSPCGPSELRYVFQGISNDDRFLIVIRAVISSPAKQKRWAARGCVSDTEVPKINALLAQDLTAANPASFQPNLDQLDAVVRSMKLKY